jgi:L-ectoine synthase
MLFTTRKEIVGTDRETVGQGWASRRFLTAEDGLPFSFHETTVAAGTEIRMNYATHSETVYCIDGQATIEYVAEGKVLPIRPGTFYSIGVGEEHVLRIERETRFVCVFNPPLSKGETAAGTSSG